MGLVVPHGLIGPVAWAAPGNTKPMPRRVGLDGVRASKPSISDPVWQTGALLDVVWVSTLGMFGPTPHAVARMLGVGFLWNSLDPKESYRNQWDPNGFPFG